MNRREDEQGRHASEPGTRLTGQWITVALEAGAWLLCVGLSPKNKIRPARLGEDTMRCAGLPLNRPPSAKHRAQDNTRLAGRPLAHAGTAKSSRFCICHARAQYFFRLIWPCPTRPVSPQAQCRPPHPERPCRMSSITIALTAAGCIFGGTLFGIGIQNWLPSHHLNKDSHEIVKNAFSKHTG